MDYMKEFIELSEKEAETFIRDSINWEIRDHIKARVKGTVLDMGCGNGNCAGRYPADKYTGVDISPSLIKAAQKYHPGHTFLVCDASSTPFDDRSFQYVFCVSVLEHMHSLKDTRSILKEMVRLSSEKVLISWHHPPSTSTTTQISSSIDRTGRHFGHKKWSNQFNTHDLIEGIIDKDQLHSTKHQGVSSSTAWLWEISTDV